MANYIQEVPIEGNLNVVERKRRSLLNMALQPGRNKQVNSNDFTKKPLELNEEEKQRRAMRLEKKYRVEKGEYTYKDAPHTVAFKDKGGKIVGESDDRAISGMVELAAAKGWSSVKVSGNREFKRKAWEAAKLSGLEVKGFKPTDKELKELEGKEKSKSKSESRSPAPSNTQSAKSNPDKNKVFEGTLVNHGVAPFKGDNKNGQSYFAVVRTEGGDKTVWGKGLANVIANSGNKTGDEVRLEYTGKTNDKSGKTDKGKPSKINGWKISDSEKVVSVKAVADAFVDRNIKNPVERSDAKEALYKGIDDKARNGKLPDIKVYDKNAERDIKVKSSPAVEMQNERTR